MARAIARTVPAPIRPAKGQATAAPASIARIAPASRARWTEGRPRIARVTMLRGSEYAWSVAVATRGGQSRWATNRATGGPLAPARTFRMPLPAPAAIAPAGRLIQAARLPE